MNEQSRQLDELFTLPVTANVRRTFKNSKGEVFVGSYGTGIYRLDLQRKELTPVYHDQTDEVDVSRQKVVAFFEDLHENVWLGCYQKGLLFMSQRPSPFTSLSLDKISADNGKPLQLVFADPAGHVYIGQEQNGLMEIDEQGCVKRQWPQVSTPISAYTDQQGDLWVGTQSRGAFRINHQTNEVQAVPGLDGQRVKSITSDRQGNLYMAILNGTLRSFTPNMEERTLGKGSLQLHNRYLNTLMTDREGRIWIGHYYGIDVYNPQKDQLEDIPIDSILRSATVYAITESKDRRVWAGTNRGLFCYDKRLRKWRRFTNKDGLPNNIICGIIEAADSSLWLSTYRGMARMDTRTGTFVNYYKGNGIEDFGYLRGVFSKSPYGQIFFGNNRGLVYFSPERINKNEFTQPLTLTGLVLDNQQVPQFIKDGQHITLSYKDNTFTLQFSTMDFREMENVRYEYRFADEAKDVWHQMAAGSSNITFTHLSPGTHKLQVRAMDNGVYSPVKEITIRITPPWYRSWWAYTLYLLMLLGIGYWLWLYWRHKQLAETNESKIRFFVDVCHELRSPLTLIKSPLDTLLRGQHDAQTTRALRNMQRNTDRLLQLVNQILSIRKIEKGQLQLHYAETNMTEFVGDLCHDYDYEVDKRKINLSFQNEEGTDMNAWIDREHFDKVISNLISNALKYVEDGGYIAVDLRKVSSTLLLTVKDSGPGIDEEQLKKIFDRFYQTSARPRAGQMGYGIGLNLTYKLVQQHGGTIVAHNRTDGKQGSEFVVSLPTGNNHLPKELLVDDAFFAGQQSVENTPVIATDADKPRRIRKKTTYRLFVVDDDAEIRNFLKTELGDTYHVALYENGAQALEAAADEVPDLIISDVMMPEMDGFTLLHRIKNSTKTSHIPIILLTTKTEQASRMEGLEEGADAYLDKPFSLEELEAQVANLIANRQRLRGKFSGMQEQEGTIKKIELKGNDEELMERMMKVINQRLTNEDFNVEALADEVGLSRVQLHRRVKEMTGITVGEFIRNLRMQQAAKLLEKGDVTIAQVTYAIGMANPTHFTSAFKRYFGITPSEYMAKHGKDTKS